LQNYHRKGIFRSGPLDLNRTAENSSGGNKERERHRNSTPAACNGGAMAGQTELAFSSLQRTTQRKKSTGERGRDGDLTRTRFREREAATTARRSVATEIDDGTGTKLGCGLLGRKNSRLLE
jgi:hypothetical protein